MPFRLPRRQPAPPTQDAQKNLERPSAQDIYEQVASNARQELGRSSVSLAISGLAGGVFMGLSGLGNAIVIALLTPPGSAPTNTTLFIACRRDVLTTCFLFAPPGSALSRNLVKPQKLWKTPQLITNKQVLLSANLAY